MKHLNLPADLVAAETVLFLGSGFAHGAMAINHKGLPLGGELDNRLAEELGLPADRYQGKTLAQIASKRPREFLKNFLTENCTVRSYKAFHANILSREWFRVYTTNFDNLGEVIRSENGRNNDPLTFRDPIPNKIDRDSIIHLHGYIGRVTEGNAPTEIIYALNAYAGLHSERPEWFAEFNRSVKYAKHVIFVGYSTEYDEHIRDILARIPGLKDKTYFILGGEFDGVVEEILDDYGKVFWCGASGLADSLDALPATPAPIIDKNRLRSFHFFDPNKDSKTFSEVTFSEVRNLLAFGSYNRNRFYRDTTDKKYLIYRDKTLSVARDILESGSSLLLHSHLGNGKTLFIETLSAQLSAAGYSCFIFNLETSSLLQEVDFICSFPNPIICIDDYTIAREIVPVMRRICEKARFVLTIRTGTFDYRVHEVGRVFGDKLGVIDLNWLERDEFAKFEDWAAAAGIVATQHRQGYGRLRHVREFILDKFEHSQVLREKVHNLTRSLMEDRRAYRAFVVLMIFRHIGEEAQSDIITYKVLGYDPQTKLRDYADLWGEVSDQHGEVESSIFSQFVISHFVDADEVLRIMEEIVAAVAVSRSENKRDDAIFAKCLNFGQLYILCGSNDDSIVGIVKSYNRLRHNENVANQPLFWLQVAIAVSAQGQMREAWSYIKVAYSKAPKNFEPYHIDTKAVEVLFCLGSNVDEQFTDEEFSGLDSALESCVAMISNERNRQDVLRALGYSLPFFEVRADSLERGQKVRLAFHLAKVVQQLRGLAPEIRARQGTDDLRRVLERSIALLGP